MRWFLCAPAWLFASGLGYFVLPFILAFTPFNAPKLRWLDNIYGNRVDGTGWDFGTNPAITMSGFTGLVGKWFPRYAWLALRNPANNLARNLGVRGTITSLEHWGRWDAREKAFYCRALIGGQDCWFIHWKHYWTMRLYSELKLGWKIWDSYRIGDKVDCALAISLQPLRRDHV